MSQTTGYDFTSAVAQAGQMVDTRTRVVETFAAEGTIPFGRIVVEGTDPERQVKLISDAGDNIAGVALFDHTRENALLTNLAEYADGDAVGVVRRGQVWVEAAAAVTTCGVAAYAVATGSNAGKVTPTASGAAAIPTGVLRSTGDAGDLVKLEINMP